MQVDPSILTTVWTVIAIILSIVVHEMAHAYAAVAFGDPTPRIQGRLSMNPLSHLEWLGSFIIPLLTTITGGFFFGWAKPVQYNPYNLQKRRVAELCIALAGPLSNILLAILAALVVHFIPSTAPVLQMLLLLVMINIGLAVFNLIPIPPLDGSKVLAFFLPVPAKDWIARQGFATWIIAVVLVVSIIDKPLAFVVGYLTRFLLGI